MRNTLSLLMLCMLSACQLAPQHVLPPMPTQASFPEYDDSLKDGSEGGEVFDLHTFFVDPRLQALLAVALENNRDMNIAVLRIEEARALYGIQRSARLPNVSALGSGQRTRTSIESFGSSAGINERFALNLAVSAFELDFWGRVKNSSKAARSKFFATQEAAQAFRLSLIRDVAFAYLSVLEASERITLAESTVRARDDQVVIARRRLDAGVTSELEFRQAETLLTQAEAELAALRLNSAQNNNLLIVLLGTQLDANTPQALALGQQINLRVFSSTLPSRLLESRPDIRAAELELMAARANIGVARAAFFPSIKLTSSLGFSSPQLDALVGDSGRAWSYGPSVELPIFDYGRRRGNLQAAKAREKISIAHYEKTIQDAFREVADALAGRKFLADQIAGQERGIVAQRRLAELAHRRYTEGVVRYLEVLDAERSLFAAEQSLLQLRRIQTANSVSLYIALGGDMVPPTQ